MNNGSDVNNGSNDLITIAPIIHIALIVPGIATGGETICGVVRYEWPRRTWKPWTP